MPEKSKDIILDYLLKGGIAIAINMQAIKSLERNDNTILGGIVYFTDGVWIWPNYLSYYLRNFDIENPLAFKRFIMAQNIRNDLIDTNKAIAFLKQSKIF